MKRVFKATLMASLLPLVLTGCTGGTSVSRETGAQAEQTTAERWRVHGCNDDCGGFDDNRRDHQGRPDCGS